MSRDSNLIEATHSIAQLEHALVRQRWHISRLSRDGLDTSVATTVLQAGEAVLGSLKAYRRLLLAMPAL